MKKLMRYISAAVAAVAVVAGGCGSTAKSDAVTSEAKVSEMVNVNFDADSAYAYVKAQCDFGARVPGTDAHKRCGDYIVKTLEGFGLNVIEQKAKVTTFDGVELDMRNIIAEVNPEAESRVLLLAHWDCRPWADSDADKANHSKPVMGANDGASGVGVLLEMARALSDSVPNIGVDIMMVDAEDWGDRNGDDSSWALGSQYWAKNMHKVGYRPMYGILLDMVGAEGATFYQESYSMHYAKAVVQEVWRTAMSRGYGQYFKMRELGAITDDHLPINEAGIPCIDIVDLRPESSNGFFPYWHTVDDTMAHIDRSVLKAVGETLLDVIYSY